MSKAGLLKSELHRRLKKYHSERLNANVLEYNKAEHEATHNNILVHI